VDHLSTPQGNGTLSFLWNLPWWLKSWKRRCYVVELGLCHRLCNLQAHLPSTFHLPLLDHYLITWLFNQPEDNPADFSYFFDSSGRRICYIAPERFFSTSTTNSTGNTSINSNSTSNTSPTPGNPVGGASGAAGVAPGGNTFAQTTNTSSFSSFAEVQFSDLEVSMDIFSLGFVSS